MNRRSYAVATLCAGALAALAACVDPAPRLVWNATASAPIGLYAVSGSAVPSVGSLVLAMPDQSLGRWLALRHYVPLGVPLIKPVAALEGQRICRQGTLVSIDGRPAALAKMRDRSGRIMPVWSGCRRLQADEILLLNPRISDSLDGRYFGPIKTGAVIGIVTPLLIRVHPDAPLTWQRWRP